MFAFCWHLKCHFERRNPLFWHFKSNKGTKTKKENDIYDFLKCFHVFYSVSSLHYKISKFCRSLALRQKVSVLMTASFERFHAFYCLIYQSWTWGNHTFSNDSKKTIPWNAMTENTMQKLLKVNPLWADAKLQMLVGLNAGFFFIWN